MRGIYRFGVLASVSWLFGVSVGLGAEASHTLLIEPGLRIGQVRLGEKLEAVHGTTLVPDNWTKLFSGDTSAM
jgi:hypothetical protein